MRKKLSLELLVFFIYSVIIGFFLIKSAFLFKDDIVFIFSHYAKDYLHFYRNYFHDFGLFRPLALLYYFLIYRLYFLAPNFVHLIPLALLLLTAILIYRILLWQNLDKSFSLILALLFLVSPLATEGFAWISANLSIIVLFLFFLQVYFIENKKIKNNLLVKLFVFQTLSVFFYETTVFMSVALVYLLYVKQNTKNKIHLVLFSLGPIFLYLTSKIVFKPYFGTRDRFITISDAIVNWQNSLSQLKMLFSKNYLENFWKTEFIDGLNFIKNKPLIVALMLIFLFLIAYFLINNRRIDENAGKEKKINLIFWIMTFVLSLIPLSWQTEYLPFRTMILPSFTLMTVIFFIINSRQNKILRCFLPPVFILLIFVFLTIQISMVNQYISQYFFDKKIVLEINQKLENLGFEHPYRSNLYLKNFLNNNLGRLVYGDYIYGLFSNYWSAVTFLDLNSGSFAQVGLDMLNNKNFSSRLSKKELLNLRPLTIISFTDNQSCLKKECLVIEKVLR